MSQSQIAENVHKTELHKGHHNVTRKGIMMPRESSTVPVCASLVNRKREEREREINKNLVWMTFRATLRLFSFPQRTATSLSTSMNLLRASVTLIMPCACSSSNIAMTKTSHARVRIRQHFQRANHVVTNTPRRVTGLVYLRIFWRTK